MKNPLSRSFFALSLAAGLLCVSIAQGKAEEPGTSNLSQSLVDGTWSWAHGAPEAQTRWMAVLTFHRDGTVSNTTNARTWYWWVIDPQTVHLQFEVPVGQTPALDRGAGMNLKFDPGWNSFEGLPAVPSVGIIATGYRVGHEAVTASADTGLDRFYTQLPTATAWVTAPLEEPVPVSAQETIAGYESMLTVAAERALPAQRAAYVAGLEICHSLRAALIERGLWLRRNAEWNHGAAIPESWRRAWAERVGYFGPVVGHAFHPLHEFAHANWRSPVMGSVSRGYEGGVVRAREGGVRHAFETGLPHGHEAAHGAGEIKPVAGLPKAAPHGGAGGHHHEFHHGKRR